MTSNKKDKAISNDDSKDDGDELKIAPDETYDTRSEATSSSSDSDSSSTSESSKDQKTNNKKRKRSDSSSSSRVAAKPAKSQDSHKSKSENNLPGVGSSTSKTYDYATKLNFLFRDARFFLIKSNNAENITLSKARGVWSTLPQNESNLNRAYKENRNVLLIFSVKESEKFSGFARLATESRRDSSPVALVCKLLGIKEI